MLMYGEPADFRANLDLKLFANNIDIIFPIIECDIENEHYRRACRIHKEIYELIKQQNKSQKPFQRLLTLQRLSRSMS